MEIQNNNQMTTESSVVERNVFFDDRIESPESSVYMEPESDDKDVCENVEAETPTLNKKKYHNIPNDVRIKLIDAVENKGEKIKHAAKRLSINYSSAKSICQVFKREGRSKKKSIKKRIGDTSLARESSQKSYCAQDENYTINYLLYSKAPQKGNESPDTLTQLKNRLLGGRGSASADSDKIEYQNYKMVHMEQPEAPSNSSSDGSSGNEVNQLQRIDRIIAQNNNILNSGTGSSSNTTNAYEHQTKERPNTYTNPNMQVNDQAANQIQYVMQPNGYGYPMQAFPQMQAQPAGYPGVDNNNNNPNFRPAQMQPMLISNGGAPMPYIMAPNPNQMMYPQQAYPMQVPGTLAQQSGEMVMMMVGGQGNQNQPMAFYPNYQQPQMMYPPQQPQYVMALPPQGYCMPQQQHQQQQQQQQPMVMVPAATYFRDQNAAVAAQQQQQQQQQQAFSYPSINYPQQVQMFNPNPVVYNNGNNDAVAPHQNQNESRQVDDSSNTTTKNAADSANRNTNGDVKTLQKEQPAEPSSGSLHKKVKMVPKVMENKEVFEPAITSKKVVFDGTQTGKLSVADRLRELKSSSNKGFLGGMVGLRCFAQTDNTEKAN